MPITEKGDVLDYTMQRFAVSALSKDRYLESVNEEILVDKLTGEILIKDKNGYIVSADTTNRTSLSMKKAISDAEQSGICGQFFQITFDDMQLPKMISYNKNILSEPLELSSTINKFLFNFDVSEHFCDTNSIDLLNDTECEVRVEAKRGTQQFIVTKKVNDMNKFIINSMDYCDDDSKPIIITNITFTPASYAMSDIRYRISLHNIFITCNV